MSVRFLNRSALRIIGITGGIACGKSTVADYLERHYHCKILDADRYARDAVTPPSPILVAIQKRYGDDILTQSGELDRAQLGQIIFHDGRERQWLEGLIHPYVRQQLAHERDRYAACLDSPLRQPVSPLVMVIPLLFESQMEDLVTEIWVIACTTPEQRQRLIDRNGLSVEQAEARIQSQWPLAEKIKRASTVIHNSGDRAQLYQQIDVALSEDVSPSS